MKDPHFSEQEHPDPRSLPLTDFRTKFPEEAFDVRPMDAPSDRSSEDRFQRLPVCRSHGHMIALSAIIFHRFGVRWGPRRAREAPTGRIQPFRYVSKLAGRNWTKLPSPFHQLPEPPRGNGTGLDLRFRGHVDGRLRGRLQEGIPPRPPDSACAKLRRSASNPAKLWEIPSRLVSTEFWRNARNVRNASKPVETLRT
jgi:hypothetical protein